MRGIAMLFVISLRYVRGEGAATPPVRFPGFRESDHAATGVINAHIDFAIAEFQD